jgi:hypothetical protein
MIKKEEEGIIVCTDVSQKKRKTDDDDDDDAPRAICMCMRYAQAVLLLYCAYLQALTCRRKDTRNKRKKKYFHGSILDW